MIGVTTYKKVEAVKYQDLIVVNKRLENYDPTHTTVLRNSFIKDIDRRFNLLLRDIRQAIIEDDVFGLKPISHSIKVYSSPGKEAFKFTTSADKVTKFMEWLKTRQTMGLLQVTNIEQLGVPIEKAWTDMYVQDSYKRGVQRARYEMGKAGMGTPDVEQTGGISASMSTPFHMDRVGVLYTRTFSDLKGITSTMDAAISRVLAQGIIDGENPRYLAKKITDATGIFRNRARTLARTEIIRAHHMGSIQEYRNWGLVGVKVQAEWSTAGYNVCPDCQSMEGKIFTLDEIEGMIPRHPNCRCMALPVLNEGKQEPGKKKENTLDVKSLFINKQFNDLFNKKKSEYAKEFNKIKDKVSAEDYADYLDTIRKLDFVDLPQKERYLISKFSNSQTASEISTLFENNMSWEVAHGLTHWQIDTVNLSSLKLKTMAYNVEKVDGMVMVASKKYMSGESLLNMVKSIEGQESLYVDLRAFNDAYMDFIQQEKIMTLYRGVGGETGGKLKNYLIENSQTIDPLKIQEASLTGYTDDIVVGKEFGVNAGGITVRIDIDRDDIVVHKGLLSGFTRDFFNETEFILRSYDRDFDLKNIIYQPEQEFIKNKMATTKKVILEDITTIKETKKSVIFDLTEDEATMDWLQYGRAKMANDKKKMKSMQDNKMNKVTIKEEKK